MPLIRTSERGYFLTKYPFFPNMTHLFTYYRKNGNKLVLFRAGNERQKIQRSKNFETQKIIIPKWPKKNFTWFEMEDTLANF